MSSGLFSIVIPVYNSENTLSELCSRIDGAFKQISKQYEIILVDDGSKDESWEVMKQLKKSFSSNLIIVQLSKNYGQHNAIVCGLNSSKGDFVVTMDDDLQHPPEEIFKLIAKQEEQDSDLVYGVYSRKQTMIRSLGSYFIRKTSLYAANTIGDGSSFRLIKKDIVEKITANHRQNFVFLDELIQWYTANISTVTVAHHVRASGQSGYSLAQLFRLYFNILINYTAVPLKMMTYGGILLSIFTFCMGMHFIYKKIFYKVPVMGYTSLIVTILFSTSIILICFGIIGQYLHRIFKNQNNQPPYSVKNIIH